MEGRLALRKKEYKKTFDEPLQWREQSREQLRKETRLHHLNKKRNGDVVNEELGTDATLTNLGDVSIDVGQITDTIKTLATSQDPDVRENAIRDIRVVLCKERDNILDAVVACNGVQVITNALRDEREMIQFEAAWALTNIASNVTKYCQLVIDSGAVPVLASVLAASTPPVPDQVMWAFGNIAGDSLEFRDLVLQHNILDILVERLKDCRSIGFVRTSTWAVSNFIRGSPSPSLDYIAKALALLELAMAGNHNATLSEACWALSYITHPDVGRDVPGSSKQAERLSLIIEKGFAHRIVHLMESEDDSVRYAALRAAGGVVTGSDLHTQIMIDYNCIEKFGKLLDARFSKGTQREAIWALSNICAGTKEQVQAVMDLNLYPKMVELYKNSDVEIKTEVAWAINNALLSGNIVVVDHILAIDALSHLCTSLDVNENGKLMYPPKIAQICLSSIEGVLKLAIKKDPSIYEKYIRILEPICFDRMEDWSSCQDPEYQGLAAKARNIIQSYLPIDHDDDDDMDDETDLWT